MPVTAAFAELLQEVPEASRTGWVFHPVGRRGERPKTDRHVGRIISRIGRKANVAVNLAGKPASAKDLRRSLGQRMADAGVPVRVLQKMMRHRRIETTEQYYLRDQVQDLARQVAMCLVPAD